MAAYERVTLNRGGRNSRFDCIRYFICDISYILYKISYLPIYIRYLIYAK